MVPMQTISMVYKSVSKKNKRFLPARFRSEKLRKVAEITHDFLIRYFGFCIKIEGFAVLVKQHALHHSLF